MVILDKLVGLQFPPEMVHRIPEMLLSRISAEYLTQLHSRVGEADKALSTLADLGEMIELMYRRRKSATCTASSPPSS